MPPTRDFRGVKRNRTCLADGCEVKPSPGYAYCRSHAHTPEAIQFKRQLQGASIYLELAAEALDPDQVERAEAHRRFKLRASRGDFHKLVERPTRDMLEQAAAIEGLALEHGTLRFAMYRVMQEETDPSRMAHALARLIQASVRVDAARSRERSAGTGGADRGDVVDRMAAAMRGHDLEGRAFRTTGDGAMTLRRVAEQEERWRRAGEIAAEREAAFAGTEGSSEAMMERARRLWGGGGATPDRALPLPGERATTSSRSWDGRDNREDGADERVQRFSGGLIAAAAGRTGASAATTLEPVSDPRAASAPTALDGGGWGDDGEEDEDASDAACLAQVAAQREAVARWEEQRVIVEREAARHAAVAARWPADVGRSGHAAQGSVPELRWSGSEPSWHEPEPGWSASEPAWSERGWSEPEREGTAAGAIRPPRIARGTR